MDFGGGAVVGVAALVGGQLAFAGGSTWTLGARATVQTLGVSELM